MLGQRMDAAAINSPWKNMPKSSAARTHSGADGDWSKVKLLFNRWPRETLLQKWGFLPVNHATRFAATSIKNTRGSRSISIGLCQSQSAFQCKIGRRFRRRFFGKEYLAMTQEIFGNDPYPYGVKANRKMLERSSIFP